MRSTPRFEDKTSYNWLADRIKCPLLKDHFPAQQDLCPSIDKYDAAKAIRSQGRIDEAVELLREAAQIQKLPAQETIEVFFEYLVFVERDN